MSNFSSKKNNKKYDFLKDIFDVEDVEFEENRGK